MVSFSIENIRKKYGQKEVLKGVSIFANHGEVIGLIGTNGAGKTTLIKIIAGLSKVDAGTINILKSCPIKNRTLVRQQIALVPQENNLERECSVFEVLYLYARLFGVVEAKKRVEWRGRRREYRRAGCGESVCRYPGFPAAPALHDGPPYVLFSI